MWQLKTVKNLFMAIFVLSVDSTRVYLGFVLVLFFFLPLNMPCALDLSWNHVNHFLNNHIRKLCFFQFQKRKNTIKHELKCVSLGWWYDYQNKNTLVESTLKTKRTTKRFLTIFSFPIIIPMRQVGPREWSARSQNSSVQDLGLELRVLCN